MKITFKFRAIVNDTNKGESEPIIIPFPKKFQESEDDFISEEYDKFKLKVNQKFPNSKIDIIVISTLEHRETYIPKTKLLIDDVKSMIIDTDSKMKIGLL